MGQARQRQTEIKELRAQETKKSKPEILEEIGRFMIRGHIQPNGTVRFSFRQLSKAQAYFAAMAQNRINEHQIPELIKRGQPADPDRDLAVIMYNGPEDCAFGVFVANEGITPDEHWEKMRDQFQPNSLRVGQRFTRSEMVEMGDGGISEVIDALAIGCVWAWPDANAVFQRVDDIHWEVIDYLW